MRLALISQLAVSIPRSPDFSYCETIEAWSREARRVGFNPILSSIAGDLLPDVFGPDVSRQIVGTVIDDGRPYLVLVKPSSDNLTHLVSVRLMTLREGSYYPFIDVDDLLI